jgi:phage/plasmid-associated DNA primase
MSRGQAAVSLPGVFNGQKKGELHPLLRLFATVGRVWFLAFDSDQHQNPQVARALLQLGGLLKSTGGVVRVCQWTTDYKGIDDYLVAGGGDIEELMTNAIPIEQWRDDVRATSSPPKKAALLQQATEALYPASQPVVCVEDKLYRWSGTHYEWVPEAVEKKRIADFCDRFTIDGSYPLADPKWVNRIYEWIRQRSGIDPRQVSPRGYFNCTNGVLRLEWSGDRLTKTLLPHDPSMVFLEAPVVKYDPAADRSHLDRVLECLDPEPREILLRTLACTLDVPFFRRKIGRIRALLAYGAGCNGKDTLRAIAFRLLGSQRTACCGLSDFEQYDQGRKFNLHPLATAALNWSSENANALRLEQLQVVKSAISGDPILFEQKNKPAWIGTPAAVFVFSCNDLPKLIAQRPAEASRWAIIPFRKTFSRNPNLAAGELPIDPRFKDDTNFIDAHILPAFLNALLERAEIVATEGINYPGVQAELDDLQRQSSHLIQFAQDRGLSYAGDAHRVAVSQLWGELLDWYLANGHAVEETGANGKRRILWLDDGAKHDRTIKHHRLIVERFLQIFPKAKRVVDPVTRTVYLQGLSLDGVTEQAQPEPPTAPTPPKPQEQEQPMPQEQAEPQPTVESAPPDYKIIERPPEQLKRGQKVYIPPYVAILRGRSSVPLESIARKHQRADWVPLSAVEYPVFHELQGIAEVITVDGHVVICKVLQSSRRVACARNDIMEVIDEHSCN